jgi:hypothetical protein
LLLAHDLVCRNPQAIGRTGTPVAIQDASGKIFKLLRFRGRYSWTNLPMSTTTTGSDRVVRDGRNPKILAESAVA